MIHALDREMIAAGVRKSGCGVSPLAQRRDGSALTARWWFTGGPYTETKEHMGGFGILECADMGEALVWAARVPSSAMRWARCASVFSTRLRIQDTAKAGSAILTQRAQRIDARAAERRNGAGRHAYQHQPDRGSEERERIGRTDAK